MTLAGDAATGDDSVRRAGFQAVSPGYFATLRIPLVRGRLLAAADRAGAPPAAVVNETFVRRYLPGRDPIGARFRESQTGVDSPELTIVGVVRDARRERAGLYRWSTLPRAARHDRVRTLMSRSPSQDRGPIRTAERPPGAAGRSFSQP